MKLSKKEYYSISEAAARWKVDPQDVLYLLNTEKLSASILVNIKYLYRLVEEEKWEWVLGRLLNDNENPSDPQNRRKMILNIECFGALEWDKENNCDFGNNQVILSNGGSKYRLRRDEPYIVNVSEIVVTLDELKQYENNVPSESQNYNLKVQESLLKMVLVMAIDGYGYDPKASKSPIYREVSEIASKMGIILCDDTVRTWLREAYNVVELKQKEKKPKSVL